MVIRSSRASLRKPARPSRRSGPVAPVVAALRPAVAVAALVHRPAGIPVGPALAHAAGLGAVAGAVLAVGHVGLVGVRLVHAVAAGTLASLLGAGLAHLGLAGIGLAGLRLAHLAAGLLAGAHLATLPAFGPDWLISPPRPGAPPAPELPAVCA